MSRRALHAEVPADLILCLGDVDFVLLTSSCHPYDSVSQGQVLIPPIGAAQVGQSRGCGLAAVSAVAVNQRRGVLLWDHLCGGDFINGTYRPARRREYGRCNTRLVPAQPG